MGTSTWRKTVRSLRISLLSIFKRVKIPPTMALFRRCIYRLLSSCSFWLEYLYSDASIDKCVLFLFFCVLIRKTVRLFSLWSSFWEVQEAWFSQSVTSTYLKMEPHSYNYVDIRNISHVERSVKQLWLKAFKQTWCRWRLVHGIPIALIILRGVYLMLPQQSSERGTGMTPSSLSKFAAA